jgi:hypothetical protein
MKNEIIEEVREARAALSAEHGYDRQRIYEWARATTAAHKQAQRGTSPNKKLDAGNGSKAICRLSNVLRSPSPDPKRSAKKQSPLP